MNKRPVELSVFKLIVLACLATLPAFLKANPASPVAFYASPLEGRWDLVMVNEGKKSPSWLEVSHSGFHTLVGQFVGWSGSARPISEVHFADNKVSFTIPPQWEAGTKDLVFEAVFAGDSLAGTLVSSDGKKYDFTGHRAPLLKRSGEPVWGKQVRLFNGKDLSGWHAQGENQWKAVNGELVSPRSGSNIMTDEKFTDFKLHIEFKYPKGSNSGIYLRGRYEVQIADSKGMEPLKDLLGAVYGFLTPVEMAAKDADEWQTYDITLVGRVVSVTLNGKLVICNQTIPGITGGALDSDEGQPGPIFIQGDHGPVSFRNILITPAK